MMGSVWKSNRARRSGIVLLGVLMVALSGAPAIAVDIHPSAKQELIADGRWERTKEVLRAAKQAGMDAGQALPRVGASTNNALVGSRIPCILVEFTDSLWENGVVNATPEHMDSMLFSEGVYPTGSMRDYYLEVSYGTHSIEGEIIGPVQLPQPYSYYIRGLMGIAQEEPNSRTIARDAILAADELVDFSQFDMDSNGFVDGVMIVVAGYGYEESVDSNAIHSHRWAFKLDDMLFLDGITIKDFTIQPEEHGPFVGGGMNSIGVYCHEWGHIYGLLDLYDFDGSSWGMGIWSLMANGNYLNDGNTPAHFDPWSKMRMGWVNVDTVQINLVDEEIESYTTSPNIYRLWIPGIAGNEYYLLCNRQATGFDSELPGSGLMILHIDEFRFSNDYEYIPDQGMNPVYHYKVAVVQADGNYDLERYETGNSGDRRDLYTAETVEFDDLTAPSSRSYYDMTTKVAVWNISPPGAVMTANLDVTFSRPLLQIQGYWFSDPGGDGDRVPDPGESVGLFITTENLWKATSDIDITVSCSSPAVVFSNNTSYIDLLDTEQIHTNYADSIEFSIVAGTQPTIADFYISYVAEGGAFAFAETLHVDLGPKQVFLVDGDADYHTGDRQLYYVNTLENMRVPYEVYDKKIYGSPPASTMMDYPMVIWFTGDHRSEELLGHDDIAALESYLDGGGNLFMTGQDIAQQLRLTEDSLFLVNYLGARFDGNEPVAIFLYGPEGDPVGKGIKLVLGGFDGASNQSSPDKLAPVPGASTSFIYAPPYGSGSPAAVSYETATFKTAFWGFGFEAITALSVPDSGVTREAALWPVLSWLGDLTTGILEDENFAEEELAGNIPPSRYTLFQNYPNPFNGRTVIEYSVASGQIGSITIDIIDILGRKVACLFEGAVGAGLHRTVWDGTDRHGRPVASGVYFYRIFAEDGFTQARRLVYLK